MRCGHRSVHVDGQRARWDTLRHGRGIGLPLWQLRRVQCRFRLHRHGKPLHQEDDRLQLGPAGLQGRHECGGRHRMRFWNVLLWRHLRRVPGRERVYASRPIRASFRKVTALCGAGMMTCVTSTAGFCRWHGLSDEQRSGWCVRWARQLRGVYGECCVHATGQALGRRHDDLRQWAGVRLSDEHQRG